MYPEQKQNNTITIIAQRKLFKVLFSPTNSLKTIYYYYCVFYSFSFDQLFVFPVIRMVKAILFSELYLLLQRYTTVDNCIVCAVAIKLLPKLLCVL